MTEIGLLANGIQELTTMAAIPVQDHIDLTTLQAVLLSAPPRSLPLYWNDNRGPSGRGAAIELRNGALQFGGNACIQFDTYFNCFYELAWFDHTGVREVVLEIRISGTARVSVFRSSPNHVRQLLTSATNEVGDRLLRVAVKSVGRSRLGRLHFEVEATGNDLVTIASARWATRCRLLRQPKLALAMCTFNKPEAVVANVSAVLDAVGGEDWLHQLIVVDQGTKKVGEQPSLIARQASDPIYGKLRIVEQGNFGGAGGFARGIIEAMASPQTTHVILMDDDVEVEPRVFERLHAFLGFATKDVIVGGQMFDIFSPLIMRTFAEAADYQHLRYKHVGPDNIDFAQPFSTDMLEGAVKPTYNGWWLCTYPRSLIEEHKLPLPVFVRCDDSEYSTRMTSQGAVLVSLPGFMIWHEPFHAKVVAWMMYYETRNFLLLSLLRAGPHGALTMLLLLGRIWTFAARGLYDHSEALLRALESFLDGPKWLVEDPRERHSGLTRDLKALAPEVMLEGHRPGFVVDPWRDSELRGGRKRRFARSLYHHLLRAPKGPQTGQPLQTIPINALTWPLLTGKKVVGVYNPYTNQSFVLRINRRHAREHLRRGVALVRRWWVSRNRLAAEYNRTYEYARTEQAWTRYLGLRPSDHSLDPETGKAGIER